MKISLEKKYFIWLIHWVLRGFTAYALAVVIQLFPKALFPIPKTMIPTDNSFHKTIVTSIKQGDDEGSTSSIVDNVDNNEPTDDPTKLVDENDGKSLGGDAQAK